MYSDAFIIYEDSMKHHNQVKGREMIAYFVDQTLDKIDVNGNGESVYFALDEITAEMVGMNKILCSNLQIIFKEGKIEDI
jgi:hypothetical protein